jgi:hypothetical protein
MDRPLPRDKKSFINASFPRKLESSRHPALVSSLRWNDNSLVAELPHPSTEGRLGINPIWVKL